MKDVARRIRHHPVGWKYVLNGPALTWRRTLPQPGSPEAALVATLRRDGIAMTTGDELGIRSEIEALQRLEHELERLDPVEKDYLSELLGHRPVLDPAGAPAQLAARLFPIADAHLGVFAQLRYFNVWHNSVTLEPPKQSQLWHRDRDDFKILKMFVYLSDVGPGAGPFWYARSTHSTGSVRRDAPCEIHDGVARSDDADLATILPRDRWVQATGPAGTVVLADTSGYHRGGWCRTEPRSMFTAMFTSPGSHSRDWFERPGDGVADRRFRYRWS